VAFDKNKFNTKILIRIILKKYVNNISEYFHLAGYRYWTASLLPALIGTTLPFWLNPPGFKFKLFEAVLFLIAAVICHAGFSLLHASFKDKHMSKWNKNQLLRIGIISLVASVLIGLYLNNLLQLNKNVYEYIFIIYGLGVMFVGVLYVSPPFNFSKQIGGEVILCVGLGMMPVLGAYLIQAGDLTRTVYLASLPIVVSTGLWLWITELISKTEDESLGYKTTVMVFPFYISSRFVTIALTILIYATLILAVFVRSSLNPLSLIALFSIVFTLIIIKISWNEYENVRKMRNARKYAFLIHLTICIVIIASSLSTSL
jgi:1,4-dihydroxy-2-naphthoate octaprenyltransferase